MINGKTIATILAVSSTATAWTSLSPTNNNKINIHNNNILQSRRPVISARNAATRHLYGSNIVLGPSEDDRAAFDSLKVGSAKVHRYSVDTDPDSNTEYVMWYHGRCHELDADKSLPPLSTGRIGRATSKNGLHWKKDTEGNDSEDIEGVSLGLNKESWWGFDTEHCGLGSVLLPMSTPAVMMEGGIYLKYFFGGSGQECPIVNYLEDPPESMADAKIKGMKMRIGVAVSQDGISWGRVEGDDPTGACIVPYDPNDPTQDVLEGIEEELYVGWPEVVVSLGAERAFSMYYSTMLKEGKQKAIARAESTDGFRWTKTGVCLRPDADGMDAGGCARCCVLRDAEFDGQNWKELDSFTMYYEGVSKQDNKHRIMKATSANGKDFTKVGLVFDIGADGEWDCEGVGSPDIIRLDDGSLRMYYTGQGKGGATAIGIAALSESNEWVREQAALTFA